MFSRRLLLSASRFGPIAPLARLVSQKAHFQRSPAMEEQLPVRPDPIVTRLESAEFKSIFNAELDELIGIFRQNNYELRIAGGAVRDLLLHKPPTDIDFATCATPAQMKHMFETANIRMINANGERHGTITPRIRDAQFEVTTLRIDTATNGRHAEVEFTTDWQLDANRRDLTINSMFLDFDGNVYDYFYGYDDLQQRRVRFVGAADQRIKEDYLRILRYFRFYGRTARQPDEHEAATLAAIAGNIEGLARMSGERIWGEVQKILQGPFAGELLLKMVAECGAAKHIGLPAQPNCEQFRRVCAENERLAADDRMAAITMLCGFLDTPEQAFDLHARLKLSAYERDLAKFLTVNAQATAAVDDLLFYQKECFNTLGTPRLQCKMILELLKFNGKRELFEELKAWEIPVYPLNGQQLRERGCPGGAEMGLVQRKLREAWRESRFQLGEEELLGRLAATIEEVKAENPSPPKRQKAQKQ